MSDRTNTISVNETTGITGGSWVVPTYYSNGNMKDMPIPGNETVKQTGVYDAWNRLAQVKDNTAALLVILPPAAADTSALADPPHRRVAVSPRRRVGFAPNGLNWRVQKLLGSSPSSPTSYYDYYYNENWQVLEERKGGSTHPYAQYVWDARYIDAPVVRFHDSNTDGTIDDTLYYTTDANMNVTALVDSGGTVQERYTYDAYGQVHISDGNWTARTSSSYDNQILFGGYRFDPESGLDHVRNRMYHPTLGRWMSRDPAIDWISLDDLNNSPSHAVVWLVYSVTFQNGRETTFMVHAPVISRKSARRFWTKVDSYISDIATASYVKELARQIISIKPIAAQLRTGQTVPMAPDTKPHQDHQIGVFVPGLLSNPLVYDTSNPINQTDPSGTWPKPSCQDATPHCYCPAPHPDYDICPTKEAPDCNFKGCSTTTPNWQTEQWIKVWHRCFSPMNN